MPKTPRQLRAYIATELSKGIDSETVLAAAVADGQNAEDARRVIAEVSQAEKTKAHKIIGISAVIGLFCLIGSIAPGDNSELRIDLIGVVFFSIIGVIYGIVRRMKLH